MLKVSFDMFKTEFFICQVTIFEKSHNVISVLFSWFGVFSFNFVIWQIVISVWWGRVLVAMQPFLTLNTRKYQCRQKLCTNTPIVFNFLKLYTFFFFFFLHLHCWTCCCLFCFFVLLFPLLIIHFFFFFYFFHSFIHYWTFFFCT